MLASTRMTEQRVVHSDAANDLITKAFSIRSHTKDGW